MSEDQRLLKLSICTIRRILDSANAASRIFEVNYEIFPYSHRPDRNILYNLLSKMGIKYFHDERVFGEMEYIRVSVGK
jgi:hypothetical protein